MNCFEWESRASDYLDGSLIGPQKSDADDHLMACADCNDRYKHYRLILSSIASQPRTSLPIPMRKAPMTAGPPRLDVSKGGRSLWERIPWYIRTSLEGGGVVLGILLAIAAIPKIRSLYERNLERNLNEFTDNLNNANEAAGAPAHPPAAVPAAALPGDTQTVNAAERQDDFASGEGDSDDEEEVSIDASDDIRAGKSEIWRFNLKSDSPHEIRPKIVQILKELKIGAGQGDGSASGLWTGVDGIEAPGGIQFDLLVPQSVIPALKKMLQKIAPPPPTGLADSPMGETFTWYKNKSKRKIPPGKTRVVIWLSQM